MYLVPTAILAYATTAKKTLKNILASQEMKRFDARNTHTHTKHTHTHTHTHTNTHTNKHEKNT